MYGGEAVVIRKMEYNNMQNEWSVGGLNLIFRPKVQRNGVFPLLELSIKLTDGVEKFTISLLGSLGRVQLLVHFALDDRKST